MKTIKQLKREAKKLTRRMAKANKQKPNYLIYLIKHENDKTNLMRFISDLKEEMATNQKIKYINNAFIYFDSSNIKRATLKFYK